jgi:hypothetical protein
MTISYNRGEETERLPEMACPCCQRKALVRYQDRADVDSRQVVIAICRHCTALVNATELWSDTSSDRVIEVQRAGSEGFYASEGETAESVRLKLDPYFGMMQFALGHLPADFPRDAFADIGAGTGYQAAAAATMFESAHAVEVNTRTITGLLPLFPRTDNLRVHTSLDQLPPDLDLVMMMHVLEHLPNIPEMLLAVVNKIRPGGALLFQIPMFNPKYVFKTHYTFLAEPSCRFLCQMAGLGDVRIWYDYLEFLTVLARKPNHGAMSCNA